MSVMTGDERVEQYLAQLEAALADLPGARRRELVQEIAGHIAEAQTEIAPGDEVALLELLDRIGDPEEIAAEARERFDVADERSGRGWQETAAIVLLLAGGFLAGVGWIVGVVLLWLSNVWTTRDKLVGTLVVPGGLALSVLLFAIGATTTDSSTTICSATLKLNTATRLKERGTVCTSTGGASLTHQVLLWALFVVLLVAPIATSIYLARRSRTRHVSLA